MGRSAWNGFALSARPLVYPAVTLAAGAGLGSATQANGWLFLAAAFTVMTLAWLRAPRFGAHLLVLLGCLLVGLGLARLESRRQVPTRLADVSLLEGTVDAVRERPGLATVWLDVARVDGEAARFRVVLHGEPRRVPLPGQRLLVRTRLKPFLDAGNWGELDRSGLRERRAVLFRGSFAPDAWVALSPPSALRRWMRERRAALLEASLAWAPNEDAAALYATLAAGLRAQLDPEQEERFSRSGLVHVLSVSGLHVAALALALVWALRRVLVRLLPRGWEPRRIACLVALPVVWAYVAFTGGEPPALRSAWMASAVFLSSVIWRGADTLNALALALAALVAFDPACVADLSTQLSFLAVAALVLLVPRVERLFPPPAAHPGRLRRWLGAGLRGAALTAAGSFAVAATTLPLVSSAFQRVSWVGVLSNAVCFPLCAALTMVAAAGAGLFVLSPTAATPLLWLGGWLSELLQRAAELFAQVPGAMLPAPRWSALLVALYAVGLLAFALARRRRWALLAPAALLAASAWPLRAPSGLEVTFLSVGHGDAVVVSSAGEHALIDGGGVPKGADVGATVVLPYLRHRRIDALALAVLSHPHPDHALGLISTLRHVPARALWLSMGASQGPLTDEVIRAANGAAVERVEQGHPARRLGEAWLEVLGPPKDRALLENVNDNSVVLRVRHGQVQFLLTGDIEAAGEEALEPGPVTVMKAPHHGSRTSSTPRLVESARPKHVVFCVGAQSRFRFPHDEVVERYRALGARCYRTDVDGAIRFRSDGREVQVETFRGASGRAR